MWCNHVHRDVICPLGKKKGVMRGGLVLTPYPVLDSVRSTLCELHGLVDRPALCDIASLLLRYGAKHGIASPYSL